MIDFKCKTLDYFSNAFKIWQYKFTSRSAVFDEFCKQMRFLLFVLVGNVYDRHDCVPV